MKTVIANLLAIGFLSNLHGETIVPVNEEARQFLNAKNAGDQAALAEMARNDGSTWAVYELSDQALLADVAQNGVSVDIRLIAVRKLDNQTVLDAIARSDTDHEVRTWAVIGITNQTLLVDLARNAENLMVRQTAESVLKNPDTHKFLREFHRPVKDKNEQTEREIEPEFKHPADNAGNETDKPVLDMTDNESPTLDGIGNIDAVVESDTKTEAADANAPLPPTPSQRRWLWWLAIPVVVGVWFLLRLRTKRR